jgi:hypothetical protein
MTTHSLNPRLFTPSLVSSLPRLFNLYLYYYRGEWESDQFHGIGRYFFKDGTVLEGMWIKGIKHGKFKKQLPTNELDIIRYENDHIVINIGGVRWNSKRTKTWILKITETTPNPKTNRPTMSRSRSIRYAIESTFSRRRRRHRRSDLSNSNGGGDDDNTNKTATTIKSPPPHSTLLLSSSVPVDNVVHVTPQVITAKIKKSIRIPISQAVSIGYDCEMGTKSVTS